MDTEARKEASIQDSKETIADYNDNDWYLAYVSINDIMILNVRKHTGKMSLHGFFVICLCHMAKIRIVQKRQIWIFFSVPAYAHS